MIFHGKHFAFSYVDLTRWIFSLGFFRSFVGFIYLVTNKIRWNQDVLFTVQFGKMNFHRRLNQAKKKTWAAIVIYLSAFLLARCCRLKPSFNDSLASRKYKHCPRNSCQPKNFSSNFCNVITLRIYDFCPPEICLFS
jgi:hypothetical protein